MKKKIVLSLVFTLLFLCVMAFTVGAAEMTQYCDAKITLVSGESVTGYFATSSGTINGKQIYKTTDNAGEQINWASVVVVDMRNFNYVGTTPTKMNNFGKTSTTNIVAINVEQLYLPDTLVTIPMNLVTKEWVSIKSVYIPKSVETITLNAFNGSLISSVTFEEGSNLKNIGVGAFRNCAYLETIEIPDGVTTIGNYAFAESSIGGEITLPNSVEKVGDGAFGGTKIESISFGNAPLTLGKNVVGHDTINTEYLKKIYISVGTEFSTDASQMWYPTKNEIISFYVVSEGNEDTSEFIQKLRLTGRLTFTTTEELENGIAPEGYDAIIYESVSVCDAFNNGAHNQPGEADLIFTNAFTEFYEAKECIACNRYLPTGDTYEAIISLVGYSTRENGTGFCVEYRINRTSYEKYREYQ
ncbi:MAG: leucine-rich repeat domain-containing protein, partial [Clostridia bacterium]|nr:leucine-rich repeat domain-containing protein [Clostridia bacterium]